MPKKDAFKKKRKNSLCDIFNVYIFIMFIVGLFIIACWMIGLSEQASQQLGLFT